MRNTWAMFASFMAWGSALCQKFTCTSVLMRSLWLFTCSIRGKTLVHVQETQDGFQACLSLLKYASPSLWLLVAKKPRSEARTHSYSPTHLCSSVLEFTETALCVGKTDCTLADQQTHGRCCPRGAYTQPRVNDQLNYVYRLYPEGLCLHSQDTVPLLPSAALLVQYSTGIAVFLCRTMILHLLVALLSYPT